MSNQGKVRATATNPRSINPWMTIGVAIAFFSLLKYFFDIGVNSPRIANPEVTGTPRPVEYLFGIDWLPLVQYGTVIGLVLMVIACAVVWRRRPGHPNVLMAIASTAIIWQDPVMNWATYAVYNPQLWHLPEDWFLVNMSPTVEPFIVVIYAFFFFGPYFPAIWVLRRLQAKRPMDAFVWRRPLLSLVGLIFVIGFFFDALLEITALRTGVYIYAQVIPWGSLFTGTPFQFALIWQASLITLVMIPAGVLCYRDDTGRTVAEKLAQRLRFFNSHPLLATFLVMFGTLNIAYLTYGAAMTSIRATGIASAVACPWPYPEAKVYDPQGYFEQEGQPGPYFEGYWSGWMSGQSLGRPKVNPIKDTPNCLNKSDS